MICTVNDHSDPFDKTNLVPAFVQSKEQRITTAWRRLQELPTLGIAVTEYPLRQE